MTTIITLSQPARVGLRLVRRVTLRAPRIAEMDKILRGWTPGETGPEADERADRIAAAVSGLPLRVVRALPLEDYLAIAEAAPAVITRALGKSAAIAAAARRPAPSAAVN